MEKLKPDETMMKIICAVVLSLAAATVHAVPKPAPASARHSTPTFATWHMADLQDVTQAWYFTGEALAGQVRDGTPWAADRLIVRPAETALAPPPPPSPPAAQAAPAQVTPPPTLPEPHMASMLLVGLVLIFLRASHKEAAFG